MVLCYAWSFSALNKRKEMFSTSEILSKLKDICSASGSCTSHFQSFCRRSGYFLLSLSSSAEKVSLLLCNAHHARFVNSDISCYSSRVLLGIYPCFASKACQRLGLSNCSWGESAAFVISECLGGEMLWDSLDIYFLTRSYCWLLLAIKKTI